MNQVRSFVRPLATAVLLLSGVTVGCAPAVAPANGVVPPLDSTPTPSVPTAEAPAEADTHIDPPDLDLSAHSATDPASPWVVVNKRTPLDPIDFEPELTTVRGYLVQPVVAEDLSALLAAAEHDGVSLTLRSAYRSYGYQSGIFDGWVEQLGPDEAIQVSAPPGHSEHQTGLAVDLGSSTRPECDFSACFDDTVEGRWIAAHVTEFGFLLRYTADAVDITGFSPEGWHVRYVGRDLADYMERHSIRSLEDVFGVPGGSPET